MRKRCTLSGLLSAWWVPREFPSLACLLLSSVVRRIRLLIHHLQKKAKRVGIVCCGLSARFKTVLDLFAANLDSNHRLGSSSLSFQRGFVFVFEQNLQSNISWQLLQQH